MKSKKQPKATIRILETSIKEYPAVVVWVGNFPIVVRPKITTVGYEVSEVSK